MPIEISEVQIDSVKNPDQSIVSRGGVRITLHDADGTETITVSTPGGQILTLRDGPSSVQLVTQDGNSITMDAAGITIGTSGRCAVLAGAIEISTGEITVNAGLTKFSGVVKADTVIANSVIASSYSPGAGNIW